MAAARDPAASYGIAIPGTTQILTVDLSQKGKGEIHRKYLSRAAVADAGAGPVFAACDDVTIEIRAASVISWDTRPADREFCGGVLESNPAYRLPLWR
jgi:hypothetical protein